MTPATYGGGHGRDGDAEQGAAHAQADLSCSCPLPLSFDVLFPHFEIEFVFRCGVVPPHMLRGETHPVDRLVEHGSIRHSLVWKNKVTMQIRDHPDFPPHIPRHTRMPERRPVFHAHHLAHGIFRHGSSLLAEPEGAMTVLR